MFSADKKPQIYPCNFCTKGKIYILSALKCCSTWRNAWKSSQPQFTGSGAWTPHECQWVPTSPGLTSADQLAEQGYRVLQQRCLFGNL